MVSSIIRLATRGSNLALWQARHVSALIQRVAPDITVELVVITTRPDRLPNTPLRALGGDKGLFVKEVEQALLDGRADGAVHSLKDVPVEETTAGLSLVAFPQRAAAGDGLICRGAFTLKDLPAGGVVGTSALRRQAQLLHRRPDLRVAEIRGNVETRLRKLDEGEYDAIIMAVAGLERLGLEDRFSERFSLSAFLPAPGQGILAVQAPENSPFASLWKRIDDSVVRQQARGERLFSRLLGATCHSAAACYLRPGEGGWHFCGAVFSPDGKIVLRESASHAEDPAGAVERVAGKLLEGGARELL